MVVALLGGCGGGDKEASSSAPLSKKEFLKEGNAICDAVLSKRDALVLGALHEHLAELNRLSRTAKRRLASKVALEIDIPLYKKAVRELGELHPPSADQRTVGQIVSNYESVLAWLTKHPEKLSGSNLAPSAEAEAYGLVSCIL